MPCRSKKVLSNRKKIHSSNSGTDNYVMPFNMNACDETQSNVISHLESIGNLIINELTGSERDHLKEKLLMSCVLNKKSIHDLPLSSSKTDLKQLLIDLRTLNWHTERQYRTVAIGDNDVKICTSTTNINDTTNIPINQNCNTNTLNGESQLIKETTKRKKKQNSSSNSSEIIEKDTKTTPTIITRTICTRSSKLNSLNNNQEQSSNHVIVNRARKRRSCLINNSSNQIGINKADNTIKELQRSIGNDVSGVKVSRKKLQSSVPSSTSDENSKRTTDF